MEGKWVGLVRGKAKRSEGNEGLQGETFPSLAGPECHEESVFNRRLKMERRAQLPREPLRFPGDDQTMSLHERNKAEGGHEPLNADIWKIVC